MTVKRGAQRRAAPAPLPRDRHSPGVLQPFYTRFTPVLHPFYTRFTPILQGSGARADAGGRRARGRRGMAVKRDWFTGKSVKRLRESDCKTRWSFCGRYL